MKDIIKNKEKTKVILCLCLEVLIPLLAFSFYREKPDTRVTIFSPFLVLLIIMIDIPCFTITATDTWRLLKQDINIEEKIDKKKRIIISLVIKGLLLFSILAYGFCRNQYVLNRFVITKLPMLLFIILVLDFIYFLFSVKELFLYLKKDKQIQPNLEDDIL